MSLAHNTSPVPVHWASPILICLRPSYGVTWMRSQIGSTFGVRQGTRCVQMAQRCESQVISLALTPNNQYGGSIFGFTGNLALKMTVVILPSVLLSVHQSGRHEIKSDSNGPGETKSGDFWPCTFHLVPLMGRHFSSWQDSVFVFRPHNRFNGCREPESIKAHTWW